MSEIRRLYKSDTDKIFSGVIGGFGDYFKVDSTIIRVLWVLVVIFSGFFPGVLAYIIAMMIVPKSVR